MKIPKETKMDVTKSTKMLDIKVKVRCTPFTCFRDCVKVLTDSSGVQRIKHPSELSEPLS